MNIFPRHIKNSIFNETINLNAALLTLYHNGKLNGQYRSDGIRLVNKIKSKYKLNEYDQSILKAVIENHADELSELCKLGAFKL